MIDAVTQSALIPDQVSFHWSGRAAFGLSVPDLSLTRGESVLLPGESGSGKYTLLSLICGINTAQSGSILLDDTDLTNMRPAARDRHRAEKIGIVFQQFNLLPYAFPFGQQR